MLKKSMTLLLLAIAVFAFALPTSPVEAATKNVYVATKSGSKMVYAEGKSNARVIGKMTASDRLQRTGSRGAWIRVNYKGKAGWVPTKNLRTVSAPKPLKSASVKTYKMKASAYTPYCKGCSGKTALGWNVRTQKRNVIAVDPRVIPLGTKVQVYVGSKLLGTYTAADTGGAIKGNKIDILMYSHSAAIQFGRKTVTVKVL
ncbi:MAG: SH3 domain-containing protein [Exiguobacterium sp.]|nr:SH3 domain-containing protein [Exiguobacterium sp.]